MTKKMSKEEKRVTELVRQRMKESRSTELLGFDVESAHAGRAIFRLDVRPNHKQIHGVVHGGILAALADTTAAIPARIPPCTTPRICLRSEEHTSELQYLGTSYAVFCVKKKKIYALD